MASFPASDPGSVSATGSTGGARRAVGKPTAPSPHEVAYESANDFLVAPGLAPTDAPSIAPCPLPSANDTTPWT